MSTCSGSRFDKFTVELNVNDGNFTVLSLNLSHYPCYRLNFFFKFRMRCICKSDSGCAFQTCECVSELAVNLARTIIDNGNVLNAVFSNVNESDCVRSPNSESIQHDRCCGDSPHWIPFDSNSNSCVNGQLI